MKFIPKSAEAEGQMQLLMRSWHPPVINYDGLRRQSKDQLKAFLAEQQFNLCAYCQVKLDYKISTIEHFVPQSLAPLLDIIYYNLIVVCDGNENNGSELHCDKAKGDTLVAPYIFANDCIAKLDGSSWVHKYISVNKANAEIYPSESLSDEERSQVEAFIKICKLNHKRLIKLRRIEFDRAIKRISVELTTKQNEILKYVQNPGLQFNQFRILALSSINQS